MRSLYWSSLVIVIVACGAAIVALFLEIGTSVGLSATESTELTTFSSTINSLYGRACDVHNQLQQLNATLVNTTVDIRELGDMVQDTASCEDNLADTSIPLLQQQYNETWVLIGEFPLNDTTVLVEKIGNLTLLLATVDRTDLLDPAMNVTLLQNGTVLLDPVLNITAVYDIIDDGVLNGVVRIYGQGKSWNATGTANPLSWTEWEPLLFATSLAISPLGSGQVLLDAQRTAKLTPLEWSLESYIPPGNAFTLTDESVPLMNSSGTMVSFVQRVEMSVGLI